MLGTDKSRGCYLEMICEDFLAEANLDSDNPDQLLQSVRRPSKFLPQSQQKALPEAANASLMRRIRAGILI